MDHYLIRPPLEPMDITFRHHLIDPANLSKAQSCLRKLHTFEIMAANIYKHQITSYSDPFNLVLIQAMANEMTHIQDFQIKLYEYGTKPSPIRWVFWLVGVIIGLSTRFLGRKTILKAGIWVEQKAVEDYQKIINSVPWDPETLKTIQRNLNDEVHHIQTFKENLAG